MIKVAVIFHSVSGSTKQLAEAVANGVKSINDCEVEIIEIIGSDIVEGRFKNLEVFERVAQVDAMIFGSPTFMGCVTAESFGHAQIMINN